MVFNMDIESWRKGELVVMMGRQSGKSMLMETILQNREYMLAESKPKYQFSRNWYTVPLGKMDWKKTLECIEWCEETFGTQPKNPDAWSRWQIKYSSLHFRDAKDYEWFMLRWS